MPASEPGPSSKISVSREFKIRNPQGFHARPASLFVKVASRYDADVMVEKGESKVSGKSIMGLMTLAASCGTLLRVTAQGEDAAAVMDELSSLIENKFDEG